VLRKALSKSGRSVVDGWLTSTALWARFSPIEALMSFHALRPLVVVSLLAITTPAAAQELEFPRPTSWNVRTENPAGAGSDEVYFVEMPPGWHVRTGPSAILWDTSNVAVGDFRVEMDVYLFDPGTRREPFGILVAGQRLDGPDPEYLSFVVREGGEYAVGRRRGAGTQTLIGWTRHPAIVSWQNRPGDEATAHNVLAVEAVPDEVRFFANDREIVALVRSALPPLDGVVGIRVSEDLELHVSGLEITGGR
jgi:hypothetical protein